MNCNLCNIHCPSSYQYDQHMQGRKHAERVKLGYATSSGGGRGVCFYWEKGTCYKGNACTFLHTTTNAGGDSAIPSTSTPSSSRGVCFYWEKGSCYKGSACTFLHTNTNTNAGGADSEPSSAPAFTNNTNNAKKRDSSYYCQPTTSNLITPNKPEDEFVAHILLCKGQEEEKDEDSDDKAGLAPIFQMKKTPPKKTTEPASRFPEIYRNAFYRKRNVNLYIREDVGVVFEFAYNTTIIQAVKDHIKGRMWNPTMKCWTCPLESLPDAIALYEHMGREVDESLHQRAEQLTQSLGFASSDSIQMSIQLVANSSSDSNAAGSTPDAMTATTIGSVLIKFLYDANIVASVKNVSPLQRSYNPASKIWTVDILALPELLEHLEPLGYKPNQQMQKLVTACKTVQDLLCRALQQQHEKTEEEDETQTELEAAVKALVTSVNKAKSTTKKVDRSACGQAKRQKLLTTSQRKWARKSRGEWDSDDDDFSDYDFSDEDDGGFDFAYLRRCLQRDRQTTKPPPTDCDCGQAWRQVGGRHVCRYFGTFHCNDCGNRWTSAYCWKGEKQACRKCNRESLPFQKDALDGRPPVGGGGSHDSSRCAMCRRLGYDCSNG